MAVKGSKVTTNTCRSLSAVRNVCVSKSEDLCTLMPVCVNTGDVCLVHVGSLNLEVPVHVPGGGHGQGDVNG